MMSSGDGKYMLFSGQATPQLAAAVAERLGLALGQAQVDRFSDGEINIDIRENVRGREIFLLQSTCVPTNDNLMELLVMTDALRRASARRIIAVIPYFGYARQDRRVRSARVPITAKLVANMLVAAGVRHVVTIDVHADQIQGFFDIPVDNIYASTLMLHDIHARNERDIVMVSPDVGGVVRARAVAKQLDDADLAIIDKRRPRPNEAQVMNIIGNVENKFCVLLDDIVDTAGTLCQAASALKRQGARRVVAYATHAVLSGQAIDNLLDSELDELVVTDTIPLSEAARGCDRIRQLSVAQILAETIRRITTDESISSMYT